MFFVALSQSISDADCDSWLEETEIVIPAVPKDDMPLSPPPLRSSRNQRLRTADFLPQYEVHIPDKMVDKVCQYVNGV